MAIRYIRFTEKSQFNMFTSKAECLVNQVNAEGRIPTRKNSLFSQFLTIFPDIKIDWKTFCKEGRMKVGTVLRSRRYLDSHGKTILSVATRQKLEDKVDIDQVKTCLEELVRVLQVCGINSVGMNPIGCSSTSKLWEKAGILMAYYLDPLPIDVEIYIGRNAPTFQAIYENGEVVGIERRAAPVQDDIPEKQESPEPRSDPRPTQDLSHYIPQIAEFVLP